MINLDNNKIVLHKVCHQSLQKIDSKPSTAELIGKNLELIRSKKVHPTISEASRKT